MDHTAVTTGAFTLGGVVVGGLLNGVVAALLDERRTHADARVAALLVREELTGSEAGMLALGEQKKWGAVKSRATFGRREAWEQNRAVLARVLPTNGYPVVAAAYIVLEGLSGIADAASSSDPVADADPRLLTSSVALAGAVIYVDHFIDKPRWWRPRKRRKRDKQIREQVARLRAKDTGFQEFKKQYGIGGAPSSG
jgi:hypothetical protein